MQPIDQLNTTMFDTTRTTIRNRLSINRDALNRTIQDARDGAARAIDAATDVPIKATRAFMQAFETAFVSMFRYAETMFGLLGDAGTHVADAASDIQTLIRNDPDDIEVDDIRDIARNIMQGASKSTGASLMSVPVGLVLETGWSVVTGAIGAGSLAALGNALVALVFILAVGYAVLTVEEKFEEYVSSLIDRALDRATDALENDDGEMDLGIDADSTPTAQPTTGDD